MNKSMWLARLLAIGGVLEIGAGLALLVAPSTAALMLLGAPLEMPGVIIGRLAGGGLLGLGIACWFARKTPLAPGGLGAAWGFLAYNLVASVTLGLVGLKLGGAGLLAVLASLGHGALAVALLAVLLGKGRESGVA